MGSSLVYEYNGKWYMQMQHTCLNENMFCSLYDNLQNNMLRCVCVLKYGINI